MENTRLVVLSGILFVVCTLNIYAFFAFDRGEGTAQRHSFVSSEAENRTAFVMPLKDAGIHIRDRPHVDAEKKTFALKYDEVILIRPADVKDRIQNRNGQWYEVQYPKDGTKGYMFDGWLMRKDEVSNFVVRFLSLFAQMDKSEAATMQSFIDRDAFLSVRNGVGGVNEVRDILVSHVFTNRSQSGVLKVRVSYIAVDVVNDKKKGCYNGFSYNDEYSVEKTDDGYIITEAARMREPSCQKSPISTEVRDPDGYEYSVLNIGGKNWMRENLNFEVENSFCYDNDKSSCQEYGRLYTWQAAKEACAALGNGWHLPTNDEWRELAMLHGGYYSCETFKDTGDPMKARAALVEGGSNGFNAQLGGQSFYQKSVRQFYDRGRKGQYWTASEYEGDRAFHEGQIWYFNFDSDGSLDNCESGDADDAFCVRCVQ